MTDTLDAPVSTDLLPDLLNDIVQAALRAGADAAEAVSADRRSLSVGVRNGKLEDVEREEARDLGLRVFVGQRQASVSASDLSPETRTRLVERAVAMARLAPEDPHAGFAPEDRLGRGPLVGLGVVAPREGPPLFRERVPAGAETGAGGVEGVARSEGGHASWSSSQ